MHASLAPVYTVVPAASTAQLDSQYSAEYTQARSYRAHTIQYTVYSILHYSNQPSLAPVYTVVPAASAAQLYSTVQSTHRHIAALQ